MDGYGVGEPCRPLPARSPIRPAPGPVAIQPLSESSELAVLSLKKPLLEQWHDLG